MRPGHCARCGKQTKDDWAIYGPDCVKAMEADMETFSQHVFKMSLREFVDSCQSDFAGDYGQTLEEYREKNGDLNDSIEWCLEALGNHGLCWVRSGATFVVADEYGQPIRVAS